MFGDSITVTLGGSGGTDKVLKKINQDNYSAEYLLLSSTDEIRMKVRHTQETVKGNSLPIDRHNVVLSQKVYATVDAPEYFREFYFVFRTNPSDDQDAAIDIAEALANWATGTVLGQVAGWES